MNLRDYARDKPCLVRIPHVCSGGNSTTVLAHVRLTGISGMGMKSPDLLGAWCCGACHVHCDTNHDNATKADFYEGVLRTQAQLIKEGKLKW
jgi:hypothetical protein